MKSLFLTGLVMGCVSFLPKGLGAMEKHGKDITITNGSDEFRPFYIYVTTGEKQSEKILFYDKIIYGQKITIHLDKEDANLTIRGFTNEDEMLRYYGILGKAAEKKKIKFLGSEFKFSVSEVDQLINYSKFYCEIPNMSDIFDLTIKDKDSDNIGWSFYVMWKK
jgi:hypothetical protein